MIKNNLEYINNKFSEKFMDSINRINTSAKKSAVMCLFLEKNKNIYLILTKRSDKLSHHAGEICFPGGSLENHDKNTLMAALRETYEEIGIPESKINVIGQLDDYITGTGFHIKTFVGIINNNTIFKVNKKEVSELIFLPIEVLQNKTNIIWISKNFGNKSYSFWKIKFLNYNIWGATASILVNLAVKVWDTKLQRATEF